jgi:hypothetical protein
MGAAAGGRPGVPVRQYDAAAASRNRFRYGVLPWRFPILSYLWPTPARRPSCLQVSAKSTSRGCACSSACLRRSQTASPRPAMTGRRSQCCSGRLTRFTGPPARTASRRHHASRLGSRQPPRTGSPGRTIQRSTAARWCGGSSDGSPTCLGSRRHVPQRHLRRPRLGRRCLASARPPVPPVRPGPNQPLRNRLRNGRCRRRHQTPFPPPPPRVPPCPAPAPAGCRLSAGLRGPVRARAISCP